MRRNGWQTPRASCKLDRRAVWWPVPLSLAHAFVHMRLRERALYTCGVFACSCSTASVFRCALACASVLAGMCACVAFQSGSARFERFNSAFRIVVMLSIVFASFLCSTSALRLSPSGSALDAVAGVFENAPVQLSESREDVQATSAFMRRLGAQSASISPLVGRTLDPEKHHAFASCERDFGQPCPTQFASVGGGKCAPSSSYHGPCGGDARGFGDLSAAAKERWSSICLAWWPCKRCQLDFSELCPREWVVDSGTRCTPTASYTGSCNAPADFAGYSRDMLSRWSSECGAHWPCSGGASNSGA
jgi:CPW-WPC domain-containing protein